jgi:proline racemase
MVDAPSGPLHLTVNIKAGIARETSFRNVPAFNLMLDVPLQVPGIGSMKMDVAYGGNFFGIVSADEVGIAITADNMSRISELGVKIREAANQRVKVQHPTQTHVNAIRLITFRSKPRHPDARYLNTHVFANGAVDRSPGGTGTSALLANLHAKGELKIGEEIIAEGIAGGLFRGRVVETTMIGSQPAVIPEVTGPAFVTSYHQFVIDSEDPFAQGFEMQ